MQLVMLNLVLDWNPSYVAVNVSTKAIAVNYTCKKENNLFASGSGKSVTVIPINSTDCKFIKIRQ